MPIENVASWSEFGLPGMIIAALFALVVFFVREHRAERQEWITAYSESVVKSDSRQAETNEVIRELVAAISISNARHRTDD